MCRSNSKPPFSKGTRRDNRKRGHSEDDELDPMDPSSYSDAPRGGWYVIFSLLEHGDCLLAVPNDTKLRKWSLTEPNRKKELLLLLLLLLLYVNDEFLYIALKFCLKLVS